MKLDGKQRLQASDGKRSTQRKHLLHLGRGETDQQVIASAVDFYASGSNTLHGSEDANAARRL